MKKRIKWGVVGGGLDSLIGVLHRSAAQCYDRYDVVCGCFSINKEVNQASARVYGVSDHRLYDDFETMIREELNRPPSERVEVVSVLTPNFLHYTMSKKLIESGIHVICEKPMTSDYKEAKALEKILEKNPVIFSLTHTYTGYPMVRQMRNMVIDGAIGTLQKVDVQYYQGWINPIIHDKDKRASVWRLDPSKAGLSCCMGDIGVHAFNMVEFTTGQKINKVLADINTLYKDNYMDVDATVLFHISKYIKGVLRCSQIATSEENNLSINIYGSKGYLKWEQENPTYLYFSKEGESTRLMKPGHQYNSKLSLEGTKLPPGHPEGIFEAMGNIYKGVAKAIRNESFDEGEFPTLKDGVRGMYFIEQSLASYSEGSIWKDLS